MAASLRSRQSRGSASVFFFAAVLCAACSGGDTSPNGLVEKAARAVYAGPLGERDPERDALRKHGTEALNAQLAAQDAQCAELVAGTATNVTAEQKAELQKRCLDHRPLSCSVATPTLAGVTVKGIVGDTATAHAHVTGPSGKADVELTFKVVNGAWKLDEARCP